MAQVFTLENDMQTTVNFSTVANGDIFIYSNKPCLKIDNNNPNYAELDTGVKGKLNDTDQVLIPKTALLKLE